MTSLSAYQGSCARLGRYIEEASNVLRPRDVAILRSLHEYAQSCCDELKSRENALLEAEQTSVRDQLSELQSSVSNMTKGVMLEQKAELNKVIQEVRTATALKDQLAELKLDHADAENRCRHSEDQLSQKDIELRAIQLDHEQLKAKYNQTGGKLVEARNRAASRDTELAQAQQDARKLKEQLKASAEQFDQKSALVDNLIQDVDKLRIELLDSRSTESSLLQKLDKFEAIRSQLQVAQMRLRQKDIELDSRQQQIENLRKELEAAAHCHRDELREEAVNALTTIGKLQGEVNLLSTHLTVSRNDLELKTIKIGRLEGQLSEVTKARDVFAKDADTVRTLGDQVGEARSTAQTYAQRLEDANKSLREKSEALTEVQQHLAEAHEREVTLKAQITSLETQKAEDEQRSYDASVEYFSKALDRAVVSPDISSLRYQRQALIDFLDKCEPLMADDSMTPMEAALFLYSEVSNNEFRRSRLDKFHIQADLDCWYCFESVARFGAGYRGGQVDGGEPCLVHGVEPSFQIRRANPGDEPGAIFCRKIRAML